MPLVSREVDAWSTLHTEACNVAPRSHNVLEEVNLKVMNALLRQLGQLAKVSGQLLEDLLEEVDRTSAAVGALAEQTSSLAAKIEGHKEARSGSDSSINNQSKPFVLQRLEINACGTTVLTQASQVFGDHSKNPDLQRMYDACDARPQLDLLDEYSSKGPCMQRFSDPGLFLDEWLRTEERRLLKMQKNRRSNTFSFRLLNRAWSSKQVRVLRSHGSKYSSKGSGRALSGKHKSSSSAKSTSSNDSGFALLRSLAPPTVIPCSIDISATLEEDKMQEEQEDEQEQGNKEGAEEEEEEDTLRLPERKVFDNDQDDCLDGFDAFELDNDAVSPLRTSVEDDSIDPFGSFAIKSRAGVDSDADAIDPFGSFAVKSRGSSTSDWPPPLPAPKIETETETGCDMIDPFGSFAIKSRDSAPPPSLPKLPTQIQPTASAAGPAASSSAAVPNDDDDPVLGKFRKMLKIGLDAQAVKHAMIREGLDCDQLFASVQPAEQDNEKQNRQAARQPEASSPRKSGDPRIAKFEKMLKIGLDADAVKHAMIREGVSPDLLFVGAPAPACEQTAPPASQQEQQCQQQHVEDPAYTKFVKMLKIGLDPSAVKHAILREGLDPNVVFPKAGQEQRDQVNTAKPAPGANPLLAAIQRGAPLREIRDEAPSQLASPAAPGPNANPLLAAIQQGTALRKVPETAATQGSQQQGSDAGKGDLMAAILQGPKLRKVDRSKIPPPAAAAEPVNSMGSILSAIKAKNVMLRKVKREVEEDRRKKAAQEARLSGVAAILAKRVELVAHERETSAGSPGSGDDSDWDGECDDM
ncbi:Wiskott-Aldrich syndrome protein family member 2 (WASP family protein member 2) (Protein WAVE-2) (Verprolin homology domain-containing protein 2) [Durusdinium trenchii]|uniref:Wiskott-Aldrich syndrome protein family member 2 (WASP family protein member 2) (Protein WAVE-2) (Verprolin homology domain-containing protein 2) n=1 Tax=Durusdinium trenchii TaxID=1381693 RepID=A0ABP0JES7_9DINO